MPLGGAERTGYTSHIPRFTDFVVPHVLANPNKSIQFCTDHLGVNSDVWFGIILKSAALSHMRESVYSTFLFSIIPWSQHHKTNLFLVQLSIGKISNFPRGCSFQNDVLPDVTIKRKTKQCVPISSKGKVDSKIHDLSNSTISLIFAILNGTATCFHQDLIDYCLNLKHKDDILTTMR